LPVVNLKFQQIALGVEVLEGLPQLLNQLNALGGLDDLAQVDLLLVLVGFLELDFLEFDQTSIHQLMNELGQVQFSD
jgi:hypothetical protein